MKRKTDALNEEMIILTAYCYFLNEVIVFFCCFYLGTLFCVLYALTFRTAYVMRFSPLWL